MSGLARAWAEYSVFSVVGLLSTLVAVLLSPLLAAYSVAAGVDVLPGALQLLSTPDDTLDGEQHQNHQPAPKTKLMAWWQRTCWICRNPALGIHASVLGIPVDGSSILVDSKTNSRTWVVFIRDGKKYFEYQRRWALGKKTLQVWLGWKVPNPPALPYYVWKLDVSLRGHQ